MKKIFAFIVSCLLLGALTSCGDFIYDTYPSSVYQYHYRPSYVRPLPPPPPAPRRPAAPPPQRFYNHHSHPRR